MEFLVAADLEHERYRDRPRPPEAKFFVSSWTGRRHSRGRTRPLPPKRSSLRPNVIEGLSPAQLSPER